MPTTRPLRIAAYNVENLFSRPRALNQSETVAAEVLKAHARINELFEHDVYTAVDKAEILDLLSYFKLLNNDGDATKPKTMAVLRKYRGQLVRRPRGDPVAGVKVVAGGRGDWSGWVDLVKDQIRARAIENTARVIREVGADVVGVVEAEDRITLRRFSDTLLLDQDTSQHLYPHVMVIDGNDARGIDVGMLATSQYPIESIRSHVDDGPINARTFSRDCPEYTFRFPASSALAGRRLVVMVNHLKSKFGGNDQSSIDVRTAQARRVAEIYTELRAAGTEHIVVLGDFNDTPDSGPLQPLLAGTDLRDFIEVRPFDYGAPDKRVGTFGNGTASQKIDYLLMSPALFGRARGAGIFRKGVWGGKNGTLFPHFPELGGAVDAGSDHAAIYVDIDID